jgi:hypothetical protein
LKVVVARINGHVPTEFYAINPLLQKRLLRDLGDKFYFNPIITKDLRTARNNPGIILERDGKFMQHNGRRFYLIPHGTTYVKDFDPDFDYAEQDLIYKDGEIFLRREAGFGEWNREEWIKLRIRLKLDELFYHVESDKEVSVLNEGIIYDLTAPLTDKVIPPKEISVDSEMGRDGLGELFDTLEIHDSLEIYDAD